MVVLGVIQAKVAEGKEKYLGIYMSTKNHGVNDTAELLEERCLDTLVG
jgi:hypothetical protein